MLEWVRRLRSAPISGGARWPNSHRPQTEFVLAHFIVSDDVERSRRFYTEVLGGRVVFSGDVTYVALANSWIIINVGGGPTDDKPTVTLETPRDPDRVSSFLNIRVADIQAVYAEWSARGARIPNATEAAPVRDPLLHPRSRRSSDRSWANHQPRRGLVPRSLADEYAKRKVRLNAVRPAVTTRSSLLYLRGA